MSGEATALSKGIQCAVAAWLVVLSPLSLAATEDRVTWLDDQDQPRTRAGEVVLYDRDELRLQLPQGTTRRIASDRLLEVAVDRSQSHRDADALFERREYEGAIQQYRIAYGQASRDWVKDHIAARSIRCLNSLGRIESAALTFVRLVEQTPQTPHLGAIPLLWRPQQPDRGWEKTAVEWLNDSSRPVARLIAASWLLSGRQRGAAQQALQQLADSRSDDWVRQLAEAQLWRTRGGATSLEEIGGWQASLARLPFELRAGPTFVVAQSLATHAPSDAAMLAFLQVAWLYGEDEPLAAESLWSASQLLTRDNRDAEARRLQEELIDRHAGSLWADEAERLLRGQRESSEQDDTER